MPPRLAICTCACRCTVTVVKPDKVPVRCYLCRIGEHPPPPPPPPIGKSF